MGNNLKKLRLKRGWTHEKAADQAKISRGQFIKLERGERQLTEKYIRLTAKAFQVPEAAIIETRPIVLIVGYVGAGSEAHFYDTASEIFEEAPPVQDATDSTVAVEIRGASLGPLFDRWLAYYDDVRTPPTPDLIGELCIVGLEDGRVLAKKLRTSRVQGMFDLWSNYEEPIFDVAVGWAAKIKAIRPR